MSKAKAKRKTENGKPEAKNGEAEPDLADPAEEQSPPEQAATTEQDPPMPPLPGSPEALADPSPKPIGVALTSTPADTSPENPAVVVVRVDAPGGPATEPATISQEMDPAPSTVSIDVPLGQVDLDQVAAGKLHLSRHVEIGRLTHDQKLALRRLQRGLDQSGARLANGKRIGSNADAVRWLLEQVAKES